MMRHPFYQLGVLAAAVCAAGLHAAEPVDAEEVFRRVSPAVVTVYATDDKGGIEAQGSGVVIGAGLVVTNCHVVQDATKLAIDAGQKRWEASWVRRDASRDVCLLSAAGLNAPTVGMRDIATLGVGEAVFAIGNPLGFGVTVSSGLVSGLAGKGSAGYVVNTAAQSPGSSGGGLFDREGRLVGVTTATLGTGQNLNLALATDGIATLYKQGQRPPENLVLPVADRQWQLEAEALQQSAAWKKLEAHAAAWRAYHPESAPAMVYQAMAQNELGLPAAAMATLEKAVSTDDHFAFAWLNYAIVARAMGRKDIAVKALDRAQGILPNYSLPSEVRASWALQEKNPSKAREDIRKAIRLAPGRPSSWRLLGQSEEMLGNGNAAVAAYRVALRLGDTSPEIAQSLTKQLADAGKPDEASAVAGKAVLGRSEAARSELAIGHAELKRNRLAPAESAMKKAVEQAPELHETWQGLAAVMIASKRPREAEHALDEALKRSPDNADILANRAVLRREMGSRSGAEDDIRKALARDPGNIGALRIQSVMLVDARNFRGAVAVLAKMDSLGAAGTEELISLGDCQAETGAYIEALATLARAEPKAGDNVRFYQAKAKAEGRSGKLQESLVSLENALRIDSTNQWAWSSKGYALLKLGRTAEAVETLETAVRLAPDFANGWINLGQAQMQARNLGRAITALEKGIALAPDAMDARLYLAQSYLSSRITPKAREQANWLITKQPAFAPAHAILTLACLLESDFPGATQNYGRLRALSPEIAKNIRQQALAAGVSQARGWAE